MISRRWWPLLFGLLLGMLPVTGSARVIGILFDDSGSMQRRIQLPAFGAQLLVSTLSGRNGEDRLFTARMSQFAEVPPYTAQAIETGSQLEAVIKDIRENWTSPSGGTPYTQVEALLRAMGDVQRPGEEAFLIVLTDGEFNQPVAPDKYEAPPPGPEMAERFRALRPTFAGPVRVDFVLINADDPDVADAVAEQGIREALLETFNGDPREGRHDVVSFETMREVIYELVARVAATDRAGIGEIVAPMTDGFTIQSPFSITRIVAVSVADDDASLPQIGAATFRVVDRQEFESSMKNADTIPAWGGRKLKGLATHLVMNPALPPESYKVPIRGDPNAVFLLFQTETALRMSLLDQAGVPLATGSDGVVEVAKGAAVTIALELIDAADSQAAVVPLERVPGAETLLDLVGEQRQRLTAAPEATRLVATLPTGEPGLATLEASLRVRGFVTTFARPQRVRVVDHSAQVAIKTDRDPQDVLRSRLAAGELVTGVTASAGAALPGRLTLAIEGSPAWLRLVGANDAALEPAPFAGGGEVVVRAELRLTEAALDTSLLDRIPSVRVIARTDGGPVGEAAVDLRISLDPGAARLVVTSHTQHPTADTPLVLDLPALEGARERVDLLVVGTVGAPEATVAVTDGSRALRWAVRHDGSRIALTPSTTWWCRCLLAFERGERSVDVVWQPRSGIWQPATATVPIIVAPTSPQLAWACASLLLVLLAALYLALVGRAYWRASVFPRGSGISVHFGKHQDPIYRELSTSPLVPLLKAVAWPFRIPHQQRTVEGLTLESARGGANLIIDRSPANVRINVLARTIAQLRVESPNLRRVKLSWNDSVERAEGRSERITLLRRPEDMVA